MPKLGVDMQEGEIIEWKKQEGDVVNEGDILLEIMSDKTNMELEAEDSGVLLKITRQAGETVPVTEVIGYIGAEGEVVADNVASAPVAEATVQLESAGLEVPKAPAQAAPAATAEKAPLVDNEYDIIVSVVVLLVTILPFVVRNLVVRLLSLKNLNLVEHV